MGRKAYENNPMERKKGEMKKLLWNWGRKMEQFNRKEEELKELQELYEMQKKVWDGYQTEQAKKELDRIEREYSEQAGKFRVEMVEVLREKRKIDEKIRRLTLEEQTLVKLRFEDGYGIDYVCSKMHMSRASVFRLQDKALNKLIDWNEEEYS